MPRFALLAVLLILASALSAEVPVTPLDLGPVARAQEQPDVAPFGSGGWLAVWNDAREAYGDVTYATRISAAGEVLDPLGIRLPFFAQFPKVACGPDRCLVVGRNFSAALVDRDGSVEMLGRLIEDSAWHSNHVLFNGRDFVIFWNPLLKGVHALTVDIDGRVQGTPVTVTPVQVEPPVLQSVAFNGSRFGLLYKVGASLRFAVASATAARIPGGATLAGSDSLGIASIAAADGGFVAVWGDYSVNDIAAVRLSEDGTMQGAPVLLGAGSAVAPRLVRTGDAYVLYHYRAVDDGASTEPVQRTLSPALAIGPATAVPKPPGGTGSTFAVAEGGEKPLLVIASWFSVATWGTDTHNELEVFAVGGAVGDTPLRLTFSSSSQHAPGIATGASETLVVWETRRGGGAETTAELQLELIDRRSGTSRLLAFGIAQPFASPRVAAVGDAFLVVWHEGFTIRGRLVRDGELAAAGFTLAELAIDAVVSATRDAFLVAWAGWTSPSMEWPACSPTAPSSTDRRSRSTTPATPSSPRWPARTASACWSGGPPCTGAARSAPVLWRAAPSACISTRRWPRSMPSPSSSAATAHGSTACWPRRTAMARTPSAGGPWTASPCASSMPPATSVRRLRGRACVPC